MSNDKRKQHDFFWFVVENGMLSLLSIYLGYLLLSRDIFMADKRCNQHVRCPKQLIPDCLLMGVTGDR